MLSQKFVLIFGSVVCADLVFFFVVKRSLFDSDVPCPARITGIVTTYSCPQRFETCCANGCCVNPFFVPVLSVLIAINLGLICFVLVRVLNSCKHKFGTPETPDLSIDGSRSLPPTYSAAIQLPETENVFDVIPTYEEATRN